MDNEKEPWWNDGDKAAGLAATIFFVGVATGLSVLVVGGAIKLVTLMF